MVILQAMWRAIQVPVMLLCGAVRICTVFGMVAGAVCGVVSVVTKPVVFTVKQMIRILRAFRDGWKCAISTAEKYVNNMAILVIVSASVAVPVLAVTYLYLR
jgi:hypothetical protein